MTRGFLSGFAQALSDMIDLKVAIGYSESTYIHRAKSFDRHCALCYPNSDELTEAVALSWLKTGFDDGHGVHTKASFLRVFAKYLNSVGQSAYIVPEHFTTGKTLFVPYIFGDDELAALFNTIDNYKCPKNPLLPILLSTYFRMTYTCGLRPNEGRCLKCSDVDLKTGEIRIEETKRRKSRIIVMSDDMLSLCQKYAFLRKAVFPDCEYFFPNTDGQPYTAVWMQGKLKKFFALSQPDIPSELLPSVRVYDLRHRFATAVLNRWLDEKRDLSSVLPYLRTYMGHKEISSTAYYIHLLPENLVKSAGIDWDDMKRIIPRGELWEK